MGNTIIAGAAPGGSNYYRGVGAFDATTGKRLWLNFEQNPISPPTVADGVVYVNEGSYIQLLVMADGNFISRIVTHSTNPFAGLPLSMACRARQSGVFFVLLAKKAQDKLLSFPYPSLSALV